MAPFLIRGAGEFEYTLDYCQFRLNFIVAIQVFLSHASVDKPLVGEVKAFLEQGGDIECWLDAVEIDAGMKDPA